MNSVDKITKEIEVKTFMKKTHGVTKHKKHRSTTTFVIYIKNMDALRRWNGMLLRIDITCGKSYSMKETHCILLKLQSLLALGHEVSFLTQHGQHNLNHFASQQVVKKTTDNTSFLYYTSPNFINLWFQDKLMLIIIKDYQHSKMVFA